DRVSARLCRTALHLRRPLPRPARARGRRAGAVDRLSGAGARTGIAADTAGAMVGLVRLPAMGGLAQRPTDTDRPVAWTTTAALGRPRPAPARARRSDLRPGQRAVGSGTHAGALRTA